MALFLVGLAACRIEAPPESTSATEHLSADDDVCPPDASRLCGPWHRTSWSEAGALVQDDAAPARGLLDAMRVRFSRTIDVTDPEDLAVLVAARGTTRVTLDEEPVADGLVGLRPGTHQLAIDVERSAGAPALVIDRIGFARSREDLCGDGSFVGTFATPGGAPLVADGVPTFACSPPRAIAFTTRNGAAKEALGLPSLSGQRFRSRWTLAMRGAVRLGPAPLAAPGDCPVDDRIRVSSGPRLLDQPPASGCFMYTSLPLTVGAGEALVIDHENEAGDASLALRVE